MTEAIPLPISISMIPDPISSDKHTLKLWILSHRLSSIRSI